MLPQGYSAAIKEVYAYTDCFDRCFSRTGSSPRCHNKATHSDLTAGSSSFFPRKREPWVNERSCKSLPWPTSCVSTQVSKNHNTAVQSIMRQTGLLLSSPALDPVSTSLMWEFGKKDWSFGNTAALLMPCFPQANSCDSRDSRASMYVIILCRFSFVCFYSWKLTQAVLFWKFACLTSERPASKKYKMYKNIVGTFCSGSHGPQGASCCTRAQWTLAFRLRLSCKASSHHCELYGWVQPHVGILQTHTLFIYKAFLGLSDTSCLSVSSVGIFTAFFKSQNK